MSVFDPEAFMNETTEEANDTTIVPIPAGTYQAQIEKIEPRSVTVKDEERAILSVTYSILDDGVKAELGRDKVTIRQDIWLDTTPEGRLDFSKGKNVGLGKLRAACGLNEAGKAFSPNQLQGNVVSITTGHRPDKNDPTIKYGEVKTVGLAA